MCVCVGTLGGDIYTNIWLYHLSNIPMHARVWAAQGMGMGVGRVEWVDGRSKESTRAYFHEEKIKTDSRQAAKACVKAGRHQYIEPIAEPLTFSRLHAVPLPRMGTTILTTLHSIILQL